MVFYQFDCFQHKNYDIAYKIYHLTKSWNGVIQTPKSDRHENLSKTSILFKFQVFG